jgi:hypothetical protein
MDADGDGHIDAGEFMATLDAARLRSRSRRALMGPPSALQMQARRELRRGRDDPRLRRQAARRALHSHCGAAHRARVARLGQHGGRASTPEAEAWVVERREAEIERIAAETGRTVHHTRDAYSRHVALQVGTGRPARSAWARGGFVWGLPAWKSA